MTKRKASLSGITQPQPPSSIEIPVPRYPVVVGHSDGTKTSLVLIPTNLMFSAPYPVYSPYFPYHFYSPTLLPAPPLSTITRPITQSPPAAVCTAQPAIVIEPVIATEQKIQKPLTWKMYPAIYELAKEFLLEEANKISTCKETKSAAANMLLSTIESDLPFPEGEVKEIIRNKIIEKFQNPPSEQAVFKLLIIEGRARAKVGRAATGVHIMRVSIQIIRGFCDNIILQLYQIKLSIMDSKSHDISYSKLGKHSESCNKDWQGNDISYLNPLAKHRWDIGISIVPPIKVSPVTACLSTNLVTLLNSQARTVPPKPAMTSHSAQPG